MASYDPADTIVVIGGVRMTGYAPGAFCDLEFQKDMHTVTTGADGEAIFNRSHDRSALLTLRLAASSVSNAEMQAILSAQEAGGPPVPVSVTDGMTETTHAGVGKVQRPPNVSYQEESQPREWKIICSFAQGVNLGTTDLF